MTVYYGRPKACLICSAPFVATYGGQRTCSRACGIELRRATIVVRPCARCGTPFESATAGRILYCGAICRSPRQPETSTGCLVCGIAFTAQSKARICSAACRAKRKQTYDATSNLKRRPPDPMCGDCDAPIARGRRKCDGCMATNKSARKRGQKRRRRAVKLGVLSERYTLAEIAQRDCYRCHICNGRVAMKQVVPHEKAPTIDHIVPIAEGGEDTRANVQLAHFICNARKSNGTVPGGEQLLLFG